MRVTGTLKFYNADVTEVPMSTATALQSNKAARGSKRVCQACEVRFYDLLRDPIVCPACGAVHTPMAQPVFAVGGNAAPAGGKATWRRNTKRPSPVLPQPDPESVVAPEAAVAEELEEAPAEEAAVAVPDDDTVLEQEPDDGDVAGLVDVDVEEPR